MNLSDIAILNIKGSEYCCIISRISRNEVINLMENAEDHKTENFINFIKKRVKKF